MRRTLTLAAGLTLLASAAAAGLTYRQAEVTCPLDGTTFSYRAMGSGTSFGQRLDLKRIGPIDSTPPLPVCPKDHFIVFDEQLSPDELKTLKALVAGADYKARVKAGPSYAVLAHLFETLKKPADTIAFAHLRASWQVEGDAEAVEAQHRAALTHYTAFLEGEMDLEQRFNVGLIAGELERRLGRFDAATARFEALAALPYADAEPFRGIIALQRALIEQKDREPHAIPRPE